MNESAKVSLVFAFIVFFFGGFMAWLPGGLSNEVSTTRWLFRIGSPILAGILAALVIWAQVRKDKAPDLLSRVVVRYFERDGFCFAIVPAVSNGSCAMHIYFQNRYDRPCLGQILIRGSSSLFSERPNLSEIRLGVSCGPAEFGLSTVPWSIPKHLQGTSVSLDLAASVKYPNGRGKLLRFKDGMRVGAVGTDFWREGLQISGAIGGAVVISRPARIKLTLPSGVSSSAQEILSAETKTLWKLGDSLNGPTNHKSQQ